MTDINVALARNWLNVKGMPKVYLAGPIKGLTYDQGQDWRAVIASQLQEKGILGYSPLRSKAFLRAVGVIDRAYEINPLSTSRGIMTRDRYDVMSSDAVLFYLLGATTISVGTCIEFGWADAFRKPIVLVMEPSGNLHDHPMVREAAGFIVPTLDEAVRVLDCILNPQLEENRRG
jgi:nucleoside 2-deoxyribosyltransferase